MRMQPKITIVTPSYNQGQFLEETILSVLDQSYKNIEYIIIDGGSTDNSVEIIKKYADRLAYWESNKDKGQYEAINKGFARATGDIMCFINSDDFFLPGTFEQMVKVYKPGLHWWNGNAKMLQGQSLTEHCPMRFVRGASYWDFLFKPIVLPQVSIFWTREIWIKSGSMLQPLYFGLDFELFFRFSQISRSLPIKEYLAVYRCHDAAKTGKDEGVKRWIEEVDSQRLDHIKSKRMPKFIKALFVEYGTRWVYAKTDGWSKLIKKGEVFEFLK